MNTNVKCCPFITFVSTTDLDSDSEGSQHSTQSVPTEKTLSERLEILTNQGLIQVVKVFVDWLRTNTDIILMCAQVKEDPSFQSLLISNNALISSKALYKSLSFSVRVEFSKPMEQTVSVTQPSTRWEQDAGSRLEAKACLCLFPL